MKAVLLTLFSTVLVQAANLASGVLAGRLLGPDGRGELAAVILWPSTVAYLLLFSLNDSTLYHSAQSLTPGAKDRPKAVFAAGLWLGLGLSLAAMAATWFIANPLAYGDDGQAARRTADVLALLAPLHILGMVFQELLRGQGQLGIWNLLRFSLALGYPLFIGLIWWIRGEADLFAFALAYLLSHLIPAAWPALIALRRGWGGWRAPRDLVKRMALYGAALHPAAVVAMLNSRIDQMVIEHSLDRAAFGFYVVAQTLSQATANLSNSVAMVAFPRACAAADDAARAALIGLYLRAAAALMLAATLGLWLLAPWALTLLFGAAFAPAADLVRILMLGAVPAAMREFLILGFKASNKPVAATEGELVALAVGATLLFWLAPRYGVAGAAAAFAATRWAAMLYAAWLVKRGLGWRLAPLLIPSRADLALLRDGLSKLRR